MFHFGHTDAEHFYAALFDIGSGTVGVGIGEFNPGEKVPHLVFSERLEMRITEHASSRKVMLRKAREALFSAALSLSQNGLKVLKEHDPKARITKVFVTCSSPWSYNLARTVEYSDDQPFKITKAILNDLVRSAEETILEDLKRSDMNHTESYDVVEQASVDISVNDYSITNPLELKGNKIALSHIIGLIPKEITSGMHEVHDKLFPEAELHLHTYMLIMYCVLRDLLPKLTSLCIIDITGEAIEFGVVHNGVLVENHSAPIGSRTFVREAAELTKRPTADVLSMVVDCTHEKIDESPLKLIIETYIERYAEALKEAMKNTVIPDDVILTTRRGFEPLAKYMLTEAFKRVTKTKHRIRTLEPKIVDEITKGTGDDVYLALETRFFHKLHGCGEIDGVQGI